MPRRTRIKFCGMTRNEDINYAIDLGVDAIGLIFYPSSPRAVTLEKAADLLMHIPPFITTTAVFVNPQKAQVDEIIKQLPIHLLQFHGEESAEFCQQFARPYVKMVKPLDKEYIRQAVRDYHSAAGLLFDTPSTKHRGGTGLIFDWSVIPLDLNKPYIVAGGLHEANIMQAIKQTNPFAVEVNSGIEDAPGIKNHQKMRQLIETLWGNS